MRKEEVIARLRRVKYRMTAQRRALLDAIWEFEGHFTAEMVRQAVPLVDLSTIYRTLELLCEIGALQAFTAGSPTEYERPEEPHHHLVCRECGHVMEIADHHFDELFQHLLDRHEFLADFVHLAIPGRCAGCLSSDPHGE